MSQTMNLNQFTQSPIKGDSATKVNLNTISVQVDPNSTNTILPGDAVYMTTTTGAGVILVDKCTATIAPFGFVFYSIKVDQFKAGDSMEIGLVGAIIFAQAQGTINRGNNLEYVPDSGITTGPLMKVNAGVNPISAMSLSSAVDGDVFRMIVLGTASVVATISGGAINNTPIGAGTPSTGLFTTLSSVTYSDTISALSTGATISLDPTLGGFFTLTPVQACTINAASVPALRHQRLVVQVLTSGTTSVVVTFGTNFKTTGTLATGSVSGKYFHVEFDSDGTNFVETARTTAI